MILSDELCFLILTAIIVYIGYRVFKSVAIPFTINFIADEIEMNPKWFIGKLREDYYGFHDVDIILVDHAVGRLPCFRKVKATKRIEVLLSEEVKTSEVNSLAQLILATKIKMKYGVYYPNKPIAWLSILCYMLDGGEINQIDAKWENKREQKS